MEWITDKSPETTDDIIIHYSYTKNFRWCQEYYKTSIANRIYLEDGRRAYKTNDGEKIDSHRVIGWIEIPEPPRK